MTTRKKVEDIEVTLTGNGHYDLALILPGPPNESILTLSVERLGKDQHWASLGKREVILLIDALIRWLARVPGE